MNNKVVQKPLTNYDITNLAKELKIKIFRDVSVRDTFPYNTWHIECGVVNLDISRNNGFIKKLSYFGQA